MEFVPIDQGHGAEGVGCVPAVCAVREPVGCPAGEERELCERRRAGLGGGSGEVPVVVQADGELELELDGGEEGAGGEIEGDFERGGDAGVGERPPARPDRVRRGE